MGNTKPRLVTTPNSHIPIGESTVLETGEPALRIKGRGSENFDVISVTQLLHQIFYSTSPKEQEQSEMSAPNSGVGRS